MKELIPISEHNGKKAVSARFLHEFLESKREFATWIKDRIKKYGFVENQDYVVFDEFVKNPNGGRPLTEYVLTLDCAKEISMVEGNAKGKQARQYFIECEKIAKQPVRALTSSEMFAMQANINLENERKIVLLEEKVSKMEERTKTDLEYSTIVAFCTRHSINVDINKLGSLGRKATSLCKKEGIKVSKLNDPRWGYVNCYPDRVLNEVFSNYFN